MRSTIVRLSGVSIRNFKNVKMGDLTFNNPRKNYRASVLGLYGQNGSGKTALIDVMQILKSILCGKAVDSEVADYINVDAQYASLKYDFDVLTSLGSYKCCYECCLRGEEDFDDSVLPHEEDHEKRMRVVIFNEILSYSFDGQGNKIRKSRFIDTCTDEVFVPTVKYDVLVGKTDEVKMNLLVAKKLAEQTSRTFVFSKELLNEARRHAEASGDNIEYMRHMCLLESLLYYGKYELFVIDASSAGVISLNYLPLAFKIEEKKKRAAGVTLIPLEEPTVIRKETVEIVEKVIKNMNIVLEQLVPGLTICLMDLGDQSTKNGYIGKRIQLMSCKNSKEIPLKYESDGIKKIIMILQLLISVYNQDSVTVAIDELDSGIFEYLLGEMMRIVSEKGKGQLIFTSHNLRPLETIDRGFIAFTTTNPSKRYVRMINVKNNNNLRDFYYRDIVLGVQDQNEELYEPTQNEEIALAFREAGEMSAS
ncbi:MAG: AAA family ATPase [Lachnospiraceae bacterium]|nr:AAA family ATPase [Lachnospiraceae bacterium]